MSMRLTFEVSNRVCERLSWIQKHTELKSDDDVVAEALFVYLHLVARSKAGSKLVEQTANGDVMDLPFKIGSRSPAFSGY
jgi:hypothetical protein